MHAHRVGEMQEETLGRGSRDFPRSLGAVGCFSFAPKGIIHSDNANILSAKAAMC